MSDDMYKWLDDPFEKLDRGEVTQAVKDAYEAKISEAPAREAMMQEILPRNPMGEVLKEFAYPLYDVSDPDEQKLMADADKAANSVIKHHGDDRERKLQRTITNIHAVAKHLFHIDGYDEDELFVGVQPLGNMFRVEVTYAGFTTTIKEPTLTEALEKMLAKLMTHVSRRLEEGTRIVTALDPRSNSRIGTHTAIMEAVMSVAGVAEVTFTEQQFGGLPLGEIHVDVTPSKNSMTIDEIVQLSADIGAKLMASVAYPVKFKVTLLGEMKMTGGLTFAP